MHAHPIVTEIMDILGLPQQSSTPAVLAAISELRLELDSLRKVKDGGKLPKKGA